jgi:putative salt-induced outer membrane protein
MKQYIRFAAFAAALTSSALASAQSAPSGLLKQESATSGKTDVAKEGFEATTKDDPEAKDATEAKLSAGGLIATGNTRSTTATTSFNFRLRRNVNQFSTDIAANYARAAASRDAPYQTTVENFQGRLRYDRFISGPLAAFLAASARRDRFQGLNLRLNIDPGFAYYFVDEAKQQLWGELGYDLQYDVRRQEVVDKAIAEGAADQDKTKVRHNGRAFVGYSNSLNEAVTFKTGLEYLQGLQETVNWRVNWESGLNSKIGGDFSVALSFSLRYDNNPLPDVRKTDTLTAVSLVYSLL